MKLKTGDWVWVPSYTTQDYSFGVIVEHYGHFAAKVSVHEYGIILTPFDPKKQIFSRRIPAFDDEGSLPEGTAKIEAPMEIGWLLGKGKIRQVFPVTSEDKNTFLDWWYVISEDEENDGS